MTNGDVVVDVVDVVGVGTGLLSGLRRPANWIASSLSCPPGPLFNCYLFGEPARPK